jgi:4-hydroxy-4-methyl-2-oxoglutarate aldolase
MSRMDRKELIETFRGLRVADVSDGMDYCGLLDRGLVDRQIRPLFRDLENFTHRFAGPALTVRYVPTNREVPNLPPEKFGEYEGQWYRDVTPEKFFREKLSAGDVLVFDAAGLDVGFIGSNNCLAWMNAGAVGVVTNGGARDTDELIKQHCPVYSRYVSRGFNIGRIEFDAVNVPVNLGGVLVRPGDMVVADGDGVVVVPVEKAAEVARVARGILQGDKKGRAKLYKQRGLPPDSTISE